LCTGLKRSNYLIADVEFTAKRVAAAVQYRRFDCALFEYWHAVACTSALREKPIPVILDMHDILWQSYDRQLGKWPCGLHWLKQRMVKRYRSREEQAWKAFDGIIAINSEEARYVRTVIPESVALFNTPMGTDLQKWPYSWEPATPPRIAYYGGLGSRHNQFDALRCYEGIMPHIWGEFPEAELWLVGSNPPGFIQSLAKHDRVKVTGYIENVQDILKTMSVVICPWSGTYGFRSRLIEVMALGVPVVATPEAVFGMDLQAEEGLWLAETDQGLAALSGRLLASQELAIRQSKMARAQVETKFSFEATYGQLADNLCRFALAWADLVPR
jgi:polysaccharide biosynthesis protein PslH